MNKWIKWAGLILFATVVRLGLAFAFTAVIQPQCDGAIITLVKAVDSARQYLMAYGNPDLPLTEVMEFSDNF